MRSKEGLELLQYECKQVIANRAIEILGGQRRLQRCTSNDHVNMSQSTNDVIPTAGKITVLKLLPQTIKELEKLEKAMEEKEAEFDDIPQDGKTQLQDAVPMRLGQSFGAFAHVLKRDIKRLKNVMDEMKVLNIGATAIGTAINVDPYYLANISYELSKVAGISLKQADDSSKTEWFIHHARKDQPSDSKGFVSRLHT